METQREKWDTEYPLGRTSHFLYDVAVKAHLHRLAGSVAHRERVVLQHIREYAEHIGHGPEAGTQHVYFGHIHRVLDGIKYGGLTFHNGGAAIKGNQFRIVEVDLPRLK